MDILTTESKHNDLCYSKIDKLKKRPKKADNIIPNINCIIFKYAEIRLRFLEYFEIQPEYFDVRHLYSNRDRRILDHQYIQLYDGFKKNYPNEKILFTTRCRLYYLKSKYKSELSQFNYLNNLCNIWEKDKILLLDDDISTYDYDAD